MRCIFRQKKTPPFGRSLRFYAGTYKPNSVSLRPESEDDSYLSRPEIARGLKRFFHDFRRDTILHRGKYLAVSPPLKELVSVRNYASLHMGITHYLAVRPGSDLCSDFPLRPGSEQLSDACTKILAYFEGTCNFFTSML